MNAKVLLIDNYDSFTHNLMQALWGLGAEVRVERNDAITVDEIRGWNPTHIVISPGPGRPEVERDFGVCGSVIDSFHHVPILGVCLGHQGIAWKMGGEVISAPEIIHGKVDDVHHQADGLFAGLKNPLPVMRYHSLMADQESLPACLRVTGETGDGIIMAVEHTDRPLFGVQFHPESIGTPQGDSLLHNFLKVGGTA